VHVQDERDNEVVRGDSDLEHGGVHYGDVKDEGRRVREGRAECIGSADSCSACVWCQSRQKRIHADTPWFGKLSMPMSYC
jgi:hypothetical protein